MVEKRIWVVTDGRAGNENPAIGLAEATLRAVGGGVQGEIDVKRIACQGLARLAPPSIWSALPAKEGGWPFRALADKGAALRPPYPQMAIGAGRLSAPIVAALGAVGGVKAVQIMNPQMRANAFDLIVAPQHDALTGANVLSTVGGLHRVHPKGLAQTLARPDPRLAPLSRPLCSVLIGGPSRSAKMTMNDFEALAQSLALVAHAGAGVAATISRRTPAPAQEMLRARIEGFGGFIWDGGGANIYPALLAQAQLFVVTADSVNMASEACATGAPVFVAPVSKLSPKLERFHAALADQGHTQPLPKRPDTAWLRAATRRKAVRLEDMEHAGAAAAKLL